MPSLAFSPGAQQPSQQDNGEKENASWASPVGGVCAKKLAAELSTPGGRQPLENLVAAPSVALVKCKRDSSCKCPDCDMAASVFGIDELRKVGGGGMMHSPASVGGCGGLARSPVSGDSNVDKTKVQADANTVPTSLATVAEDTLLDSPHETGNQQGESVPPQPPAAALAPASPLATLRSSSSIAQNGGDVVLPTSNDVTKTPTLPPVSAAVTADASSGVEVVEGDENSGVLDRQQSGHGAEDDFREAEVAKKTQEDGRGTPVAAKSAAATEIRSARKKAGWGFRMARAVFSPMSQKKDQARGESGCTGVNSNKNGVLTKASPGELEVEAAGTAASTPPRSTETEAMEKGRDSTAAESNEFSGSAEMGTDNGAGREGGSAMGPVAVTRDESDLLSEDELADDERNVEEGYGRPAEHDEGVGLAAAAAVGEDDGKPPLLPGNSRDVGSSTGVGNLEGNERETASASPLLNAVVGERIVRRCSSSRSLKKDAFFECSSEVEHVLSSDSEPVSNDGNDRHDDGGQEQAARARDMQGPVPPVPADGQVEAAPLDVATAVATAATPTITPEAVVPAADINTSVNRGSSSAAPDSVLPEGETNIPTPEAVEDPAVSADAATVGAGDDEAEVGADSTLDKGGAPALAAGAAADVALPARTDPAAREEASAARAAPDIQLAKSNDTEKPSTQDANQSQGVGVRGVVGMTRRRNRRQAPQLELGMAEAYGHEDDRAKFSQAEVDAKIRESLAEERAASEKRMSALKAEHEAALQAAAEELQRSSSDNNRAKIAARDAEALEREITMLSERYGEAAAEARNAGKALREKEALLDAVTAQLMGLKAELATARAEHADEKKAIEDAADTERRARSAVEGSLRQLEMEYNKLEDSEREKRAAGILKMKQDMQALARAQFAEANKKHVALKAKLERCEAQRGMLEAGAKDKDAQLIAAKKREEELRDQVEVIQKAQKEDTADASRRVHLLEQEVCVLREEGESRLDELEAMARERDEANNGRDVSQDALARMAIRNTQLKESVADLEGKVKELEGFCTEALDELDAEKAKNEQLLRAR